MYIEVFFDVAVAQHEVLADLNGCQVLGRQIGHHVDVLDVSVRILDVQIEGLLVENCSCGVLVLVSPPPHFDHAFHKRDDEFGMLLGHLLGARDDGGDVGHLQGPVWIPGQVFDRLELPRRLLEMGEGAALGVDCIDNVPFQHSLQQTEGQVVLVVAFEPQLRRLVHGLQHLRIVVPIIRVGELHDFHVVASHVVQHEHLLDALFLLDSPPVVLDRVQALCEAALFALEIFHPIDVVPSAHHHAAAFVYVRRPKEPEPADVCVNVDGGNSTSKRMRLLRLWM